MKRLLLSFLLLGVSLFVGCGGSSGSGGTTPPAPTLQSIAISPASPSIAAGSTQQFSATGTYSDGSTKAVSANWLSATPSVATINVSGLATGVGAGTSTISASSGTVTGTTTLTVTLPHTLVSIAVTPPTATVAPGSQQQFMATGTYADQTTQNITSTVKWTASAGASINPAGLAIGTTPGATSTITATLGTISGTAALTITNPLVSIAVTPPTASVAPNGTQQFTATGTYADHSTQNITTSVTWSASVGATITAGGLATGVTPNTTSTIMASLGNATPGTAILTITNPLVSIAVTPAAPSVAAGFTISFTATGTYADNSTSVITSTVIWASSAPLVATISNSPGTQGLANGLTAGTTAITATLGSVTSPPDTLTVTSATLTSIAVTPATPSIPLGNQQQFTATGTFSDSSTQNITSSVTWTSSDTTKATIVASGLATGVGVTTSPVTITATKGSVNGTATLAVVPPTLTSVTVNPSTATLAQGTSLQCTATGTRNNGSTLNVTNLATWTSSDATIATVNSNGTVKAGGPNSGNVTITATYSGVSGNLALDVKVLTVQSVTVTPITSTIPVGVQQVFAATATFSDSSTQDVSASATWSSDNTAVATVNAFGRAGSISPGVAHIAAAFGGQTGSATLTVSSATLQSITISPATTVLAPASTLSYQAVGTYSDQSTQYLSAIATWSSSNPGVVTITPTTGVATGQSAGQANITAKYQGITSNTAAVIVEQFPLVSISIVPATATVPFGVSTPFTATGTFQDASTQNLTSSVTWATGQSSIATISNAPGQQQGLATGVAPGQTSITAVFAGVVGNATLTVTNATIVSIAITPANPSVPAGTQVNFTAKGTFSDSSVVDLTTQVTWSSSNATVATITTNGQANTAAPGTTTITATFTQNGVSVPGSTILTVN